MRAMDREHHSALTALISGAVPAGFGEPVAAFLRAEEPGSHIEEVLDPIMHAVTSRNFRFINDWQAGAVWCAGAGRGQAEPPLREPASSV